jgi:hypothetical protein
VNALLKARERALQKRAGTAEETDDTLDLRREIAKLGYGAQALSGSDIMSWHRRWL